MFAAMFYATDLLAKGFNSKCRVILLVFLGSFTKLMFAVVKEKFAGQ